MKRRRACKVHRPKVNPKNMFSPLGPFSARSGRICTVRVQMKETEYSLPVECQR